MKSRTRSTRRWRSRRPARRRWCRPWSACANWCSRPPRVLQSWLLPPIRCRRCRAACWIRWTVFRCSPKPGRWTEPPTTQTTEQTMARPDRGTHPGARRPERVEGTPLMSRETHVVGFRVGRETYGVPIKSLHEIVRVPEITAVPDAPDYLEGVINLRGKIVSVVDLRKRFGQPPTGLDRRSRILVVEHRGRLAGMIVDSASEVLKIPESDLEPAPAMMQEGGLDCVTGLGKYKGRLIILLDIAKVLAAREVREAAEKPAVAGNGKAAPAMKGASAGK